MISLRATVNIFSLSMKKNHAENEKENQRQPNSSIGWSQIVKLLIQITIVRQDPSYYNRPGKHASWVPFVKEKKVPT